MAQAGGAGGIATVLLPCARWHVAQFCVRCVVLGLSAWQVEQEVGFLALAWVSWQSAQVWWPRGAEETSGV